MMNGGNFNLSNMTTQQHLNLPSHMVNATPNQATASLNTYFNAAQSQMPQHQHQNYTQSLYGGPRQFTLASNGNGLEKTAYISSVGSSLPNINNVQRYYATTGTAATTTTGSPPNNATATAQGSTILITNNFTQQQQQQQNPAATNNAIASSGNIRFLPAAAAAAAPPITPVASGTAMPPIQQHAMYNNNNNISLNKDIQHLFSTHLLQQQHQHQHQSQTQHQQQSQQPNFVASTAELISHQFHGVTEAATSTFPNSGAEVTGQAAIVSHGFYVTPETTASSENSTSDVAQKLFSNVNANNNMPTMTIGKDSRILNINDTTNATSSTVVLDRINICINNLYTDTCAAANNNSLNSTTSVQQQQPSPIIPAIQHRAIIDSSSVVGTIPSLQSTSSSLHLNDDSYESNTLIIDEPDSTTTATTPQTPPITPEATSSSSILQLTSAVCNSSSSNNGNVITTTTNLIDHCSPCSSSAEKMPDNTTNTGISLPKEREDHVNNDEVDEKAQMVETSVNKEKKINYPSSSSLSASELLPSSLSSSSLISAKATITVTKTSSAVPSNHLTKTLTPSPPPSSPKRFSLTTRKKSRSDSLGEEMTLPTSTPTLAPAHALTFAINEDVFVKRKDGRLYLGTVMEITLPKYRICFDDKTEVWCSPSEMRKLSISASSSPTSSSILSIVATCSSILPNNNNNHQHYHSNNKYTQHIPPICVACKLIIPEAKIEVCERCGRGYHRNCTRETEHGNGIWLCKRCGKSMKLSHNDNKKGLDIERCLSFPYNENSLHWDKKHQTNKQQIYCYCGKMGNYEQNMLQCCRCLNWFHIKCTESFHWQEMKLYRGDRFFVFSCSVCNQGPEYFQRLQMNWNDLVHLCLYNLSFTNYHQKYHHLNKDILPYAMKIRSELPIPHKWINMPADEFKEHIRSTLNGNKQHFKCNRDLVKQELFYGLRCMQPPTIAVINVRHSDVLNDTFLRDTLKLKLVERSSPLASPMTSEMVSPHLLSPLKQKINQKKMRRGASGTGSSNTTADSSNQYDVYEFRLDEEDDNDNETDIDNLDGDNGNENDNDNYNKTDDRVIENDSSEDEIPIKRIMEKVKKSLEKMDVEDDNANDALLTGQQEHPQQQQKQHEKDNIVDKLKAQDKQQEKGIAQTADILLEEKSSSETVTSNEYNENHCHPVKENNMKLLTLIAPMKSRRKRKAFTRTTTLNQMNCDAGLIQRLLETSSSDENSSSSSPSTSLDLIIPPPKNFLGQNNPFRVLALPKIHNELQQQQQQQQQQQHSLKLGGTLNSAGIATATTTVIGGSVATTTTTMNLNLCSKLAALKSAGIFPNISTTNLAKAAGQGSRTVRTIKRRLSAKDIIIGPNKEVKRKRNLSRRRLSSNIEVISTTTIGIQPIPTNFFSIHAKDLLATVPVNASSAGTLLFKQQQQKAKQQQQRQQTNTMKKIRIMENTNANSNNNNSSSSSSNNNNNNINNNNNNINNDDDDDDNNNNGNNNDNDHNNNDDNDDDGDNDNDNDDDDDDDDEDDNNNSKNHNNNDKFKLTLTQMESVTSRSEIENIIQQPSHHGRRLRQRPQKISPQTSRRSSISSSSSSTCNITGVVPLTITGQLNATHGGDGVIATKITSALRPLSSSSSTAPATVTTTTAGTVVSASSTCNLNDDLKQNVNKYFGVVNRIESGEKFSISAKRLLPNGQIQYLIEWGEPSLSTINHHSSTSKIALSNVTSIIINPVDEIKFQNINGILQKPFEIKNVSGNNRNDDKGDAANEDDKERIEITNEIVDITATTKTTTTITTAIVHWSESNKEKYFEKNPSLSTLVAVAPATTTVAAVASSSTVATPIEVATSNAAATTTTTTTAAAAATTTAAAAATTTAAVVVVSKIPTEPEPSLLATSSSLSVTSP